ncbi:IS21-like element ISPsy14 family helper ATPase IstB [Pigmentiphaga daeguensis]|uniref:IS21-like element ISPsy14 family helper ATPase IstB n=1 Tax=Pigmentiphaga daeguensis TaxID=414049 RepID=A0ABN1D5U1_9BURK
MTEQLTQPAVGAMSFEERLALLVDREILARDQRRYTRLLQKARLKYPNAAIEDLDTRPARGMDRTRITRLVLGDWIKSGYTVTITGPTGSGKTWLACALGQYACRRGHSVSYLRTPRLAEELRILHGAGTFGKWLLALAKTDVLILDDWGLAALEGIARADLMEVIDDRAATRATIITSQLPIEHWHAWIGDATIADAILDRVMQRNQRIVLEGDSLRRKSVEQTPSKEEIQANP